MKRSLLLIVIIPLILVTATISPILGISPERGHYVPSDVGTKIHPFIEELKFNNQFESGLLLESTSRGWIVRIKKNEAIRDLRVHYDQITIPERSLETGDRVLVKWDPSTPDSEFLIVDFDRTISYTTVLGGSLLICALIGGWITVRSISGIIVGLGFFMFWTLPRIQHGSPVLLEITLFYVLVTVLVFPNSLGWNRRTISAICAALTTGAISIVTLELLAHWLGIVGLRNETLQVIEYATRYFPGRVAPLNLRELVVGATLVGALGVILDVTVDVTSSAAEIATSRPDLSFGELLRRVMTVSSRLVGTMTNTLLLAYLGTDMFLLLTIYILPTPPWITLNQDFVAMEVLRGLGGALGFLAAIPLSVTFYSLLIGERKPEKPDRTDSSTT